MVLEEGIHINFFNSFINDIQGMKETIKLEIV